MIEEWQTRTRAAFLVVIMFPLAACGGGSSSGSDPEPEPGPGPVQPEPARISAGLYSAEVRYDSEEGEVGKVYTTIVNIDGTYASVYNALDGTFGSLTFNGDGSVSGAGEEIYRSNGEWKSVAVSLEGDITSTDNLKMKASSEGQNDAYVTYTGRTEHSDLALALDELHGTYIMDLGSGSSITMVIGEGGSLYGQDTVGCVFNGQVTIPNPAYNVFEVAYTAANCWGNLRNGAFEGLGTYFPAEGEILLLMNNGVVIMPFLGMK